MNVLDEDDIGQLKSIKYKIKSVLEHPEMKLHRYLECLHEIADIKDRFDREEKEIPEGNEYLDLEEMKILVERFVGGLEDEIEKEKKRKNHMEEDQRKNNILEILRILYETQLTKAESAAIMNAVAKSTLIKVTVS